MTGHDATPPKSAKEAREARLAAALRENLKRRKARIRGKAQGAEPATDPGGPDASPGGSDRNR